MVGDQTFIKIRHWKNIMRFGIKGKLAPRYIGPYKIIKIIGLIAFRLALPPYLAKIHNVFHVSLLWKVELDPSKILPHVLIEIYEDLTINMKLVKILDHIVKELRNKKVVLVRVLWKNSKKKKKRLRKESWR
jgi:hypothetical protein